MTQIYSTANRGDPNQVIAGNNFSPQVWYHNGKTYMLWMQRPYTGGTPATSISGGDWTDPENAWDGDTITYASAELQYEEWSDFFEFIHSALDCDGVGIIIDVTDGYGYRVDTNNYIIDIDYEHGDGDWHHAYEGARPGIDAWWQIFKFASSQNITKFRIRIQNLYVEEEPVIYIKFFEASFIETGVEYYGIENFVCSYNHATQEMSESVSIGTNFPSATDVHGHGCLIGTSNGYILAAHEKLKSGGSQHESTILIKRSTQPEDISEFESLAEAGTSHLCYPHLCMVGSRIYLLCRYQQIKAVLFYSDDEGATWSDLQEIADCDGDWAYFGQARYSVNDKIRIFINEKKNNSFYRYQYYLESADGVNFSNAAGTYSQQIPISAAELDSNYLVYDTGSDSIDGGIGSVSVSPSGRLYFLLGKTPKGDYPKTRNTYLRYWDGSQWVDKSVTPYDDITLNNDNEAKAYLALEVFAYSDSKIDIYGRYLVSGKIEVHKYRTLDDGDTWTLTKITASSDYDHYPIARTANASASLTMLLAVTYQNGTPDYADIRIAEIEVETEEFERMRFRRRSR